MRWVTNALPYRWCIRNAASTYGCLYVSLCQYAHTLVYVYMNELMCISIYAHIHMSACLWHASMCVCVRVYVYPASCISVGEKRRTHRTFPMARPKCLMGDFTNFYGIYKAHQTNVWWTMKVFRLHWCMHVPRLSCLSCKFCHCYWIPFHRIPGVVMVVLMSSLAAPRVVIMAASGAARDAWRFVFSTGDPRAPVVSLLILNLLACTKCILNVFICIVWRIS